MDIERINEIKDKALCFVEEGFSQDISCIDAKELGEVVDMLKDMAETCKYMNESEYYCKINKAMDSENGHITSYMEKYIPEYSYAKSHSSIKSHNELDGISWECRRTYLMGKEENKQDAESIKDLEKYIKALGDDIVDMLPDMSVNEKNLLKQKMSALVARIN